MRIVLDTNVLVSGLLSPFGTCGEIVRMLTSDEIVLCVDSRIMIEYEAVLRRPVFAIAPSEVDTLMDFFRSTAESHCCSPLSIQLPDPDDSPFLEVALSANADCLVTGNEKHFPKSCRKHIPVLSPRQFVEKVSKR